MESLGVGQVWRDRRVLVTGHTGSKGLGCHSLLVEMGAKVHGLALEPDGNPHLFGQFRLYEIMDHAICDIRDLAMVKDRVDEINPEVVFHFAAKPIVLQSYREPLETWLTNLTGSLHVLEALRLRNRPCVLVTATTDKVYRNRNINHVYDEQDLLGGQDPYSASKVALEFAIESWRSAYFAPENNQRVRVATVRAGNVIGGGDWGTDRLVPDIARALLANEEIIIRNPDSIRPWQHVLDALAGYIRLAESLLVATDSRCETAWNIGPEQSEAKRVQDLVEGIVALWPGNWKVSCQSAADKRFEACHLLLSTERAKRHLGLFHDGTFQEAISRTVEWYRSVAKGVDAREVTRKQIADYGAI